MSSTYNIIRKAFILIIKKSNIKFILLIMFSLVISFRTYFILNFIENITNETNSIIMHSSTIDSEYYALFLSLAVALVLIFVIEIGALQLRNSIIKNIDTVMWRNINSKYLRMSYENLEYQNTGSIIQQVDIKSTGSMNKFIIGIPEYFQLIGNMVVYIVILSKINLVFSFAMIAVFLINSVVRKKIIDIQLKKFKEIIVVNRKKNYLADIIQNPKSRKDYHYNRLFRYISDEFGKNYNSEEESYLKITKFKLRTNLIISFMYSAIFICGLGYVIVSSTTSSNLIGTFVMLLSAFVMMAVTMNSFIEKISLEKENLYFISSYFDLMDFKEEMVEWKDGDRNLDTIDFISVSYTYPQTSKYVLHNVSFQLSSRMHYMIVGENGSGKSTLSNLILGLVKEYEGEIRVNNKNLFENLDIIRKSVAIITQDFLHFQGTIKENIVFDEKDIITDEQVEEVLKQVGLYERVSRLKEGIYTPLGQFENGVELSGGEWQKLALARLMIRKEKDIWILDEPCSNLDPFAELELYSLVDRFGTDKTIIFISHRLGYAPYVDDVILLNSGELVCHGKHENMIEKCHEYRSIFETQKKWYMNNQINSRKEDKS